MNSSLRRAILASALSTALFAPTAFAQTADQRMSALEAKIKALEESQAHTLQALQDARAEIDSLKASRAGNAGAR